MGGNQAWINIGGGFRLQPSEFAKFATCLLLARYLSATNVKVTDPKSFLIAGGIILLPMMLIKMQPDDGSTLVFCSLIFVLYREGLSPYFLIVIGLLITLFVSSLLLNHLYVVLAIIAIAGLIVLSIKRNRPLVFKIIIGAAISIAFVFGVKPLYDHVLKPHQKKRIDVVLGLTKDNRGVGYNQNQAKIAIGSAEFLEKAIYRAPKPNMLLYPPKVPTLFFVPLVRSGALPAQL